MYTKPEYRIYIDEVGVPEYKGSIDSADNRYFSLTGVIAKLSDVDEIIAPRLNDFKKHFFPELHHPDDPVLLHRSDIVQKTGAFYILQNPDIKTEWENKFLEFINDIPITIITVVLDKKWHLDKYAEKAFHPYHYCMEILMERYIKYLQDVASVGDVMSETRGKRPDAVLTDIFKHFYEKGTFYTIPYYFKAHITSHAIKIRAKSHNIACLQVSDLIAHPIKHEILRNKGKISDEASEFSKMLCTVLNNNCKHFESINRGGKKKCDGFGKVILPKH